MASEPQEPQDQSHTSVYRLAYVNAAIREMRRVLDDPESDPTDHALTTAGRIGLAEDNSVEAELLFGDVPMFVNPDNIPDHTETGPAGEIVHVATVRFNDNTLSLRLRNHADATLWLRHPATGQQALVPLTKDQQETLDSYATAAAFHLTGVANGHLLENDAHGLGSTGASAEILAELDRLTSRLDDLTDGLQEQLTALYQDSSFHHDPLFLISRSLSSHAASARYQYQALTALAESHVPMEQLGQ